MLHNYKGSNIPVWLNIVECDICSQRFSAERIGSWPFCAAGLPHENVSSEEQIARRKKLIAVGDPPEIDFIRPAIQLLPTSGVDWFDDALPSMPPQLFEVRLRKDKFKKFRNSYFIMGYFIGNVLGKYNWSILDLIRYSMRNWGEDIYARKEEA